MLQRIQTPAAEILSPARREGPWQALSEPFHRQWNSLIQFGKWQFKEFQRFDAFLPKCRKKSQIAVI
ncbi:hypothetical protein [Burkholderia gladioli]|uniref:hypothetical protein n=1 Tax=Burkholderia gladioli TaxID=28095 RepID=UPI0016421551|nr:hypothetical protein [Burkholderia gladioli]